MLWRLTTEGDRVAVDCQWHSDVDALVDLVKGGMTIPRDIANELSVSAGTVSKWARKVQDSGRIRIEGRQYKPAA